METTENTQGSGLKTTRIEALSDGVFAIVMTLLVLDFTVPERLDRAHFIEHMISLLPNLVAYIVSFMILAIYWIGHHNQFFWIEKTNRTFLWINIFFLMSIAFIPFSTSVLAMYPRQIMAIIIYGSNMVLSGLALYIQWKYATGRASLVRSMPENVKKITGVRILVGMLFYAICVVVSFFSTKIGLFLFALVPFLYMIPSRADKSFVQQTTIES